MNRTKWSAGIIASAVLLITGLTVGTASATTLPPDPSVPPPPSVPAAVPTSFTLPFIGAQLTVAVTTGPGGNLADVAVTPADGMVATKVSPRAVVFTNADGTGKVTVKSKHGSQSVSARAGSLADILGKGGWSGDVFGDGTTTTVEFEIVDNAGAPDITGVTTSDATAVIGDVQYHNEEGESSARVSITFTKDGQSRSLTISAKVEPVENESDDDDSAPTSSVDPAAPAAAPAVEATLRVTLSRLRGVPVIAADAAGAKVWNGLLCDGTAAQINYMLNEDGTISDVTATPEASRIKSDDNDSKVEVRWGDHERVRISARLENGEITLNVSEKIRCENAADPTLNVPTSLDANNGDDHDGEDESDDDHGGDHHGGGHGGNNDTTTSDVAGAAGAQGGNGGHHGGNGGGDGQQDD